MLLLLNLFEILDVVNIAGIAGNHHHLAFIDKSTLWFLNATGLGHTETALYLSSLWIDDEEVVVSLVYAIGLPDFTLVKNGTLRCNIVRNEELAQTVVVIQMHIACAQFGKFHFKVADCISFDG